MPSVLATRLPLPSTRPTSDSFEPPVELVTIFASAVPVISKVKPLEPALPTSTEVTPLSAFHLFWTFPNVLMKLSKSVPSSISSLSASAVSVL